ncbi:MAG: hypothetical protein HZC10_07385 [Nitrospirae bacterium]|nr:hypothetical protein [Nitrospirota bacterium]
MNPVGLAPKVHIDEKILIGIAISVATAGILLSWLMYLIRTGIPDALSRTFSPIYKLFLNKWYVDEIYDAIIVNPVKRFSVFLWNRFDEAVIDGIVNGTAKIIELFSKELRRLQTGYVHHYAFGMALGLAAMLSLYLIFR